MQPYTWPLLKRRVAYVLAPRLAWLSVLMVALSILVVFNVRHEVCIRWWGMLLQLIGVWAVVMELRQAQDKHGLGFGQWWSEFKTGWPRSAGTMFGTSTSSCTMTGYAPRVLQLPALDMRALPDSRLLALEAHARHFLAEVSRIDGEIAGAREAAARAIREEVEGRANALAALQADARAGDERRLPFSFFGAGSLFVGVFLATAAVELAKWVQ